MHCAVWIILFYFSDKSSLKCFDIDFALVYDSIVQWTLLWARCTNVPTPTLYRMSWCVRNKSHSPSACPNHFHSTSCTFFSFLFILIFHMSLVILIRILANTNFFFFLLVIHLKHRLDIQMRRAEHTHIFFCRISYPHLFSVDEQKPFTVQPD